MQYIRVSNFPKTLQISLNMSPIDSFLYTFYEQIANLPHRTGLEQPLLFFFSQQFFTLPILEVHLVIHHNFLANFQTHSCCCMGMKS